MTFSTATAEDLRKAGVTRRQLVFEPAKVTELTKGLTTNAEAEIADLHSRIKKIYARVNMDVHLATITFRLSNLIVVRKGSRMILEAILLALAEIASTQKKGVAILPEMKITQGDGVQIPHSVSGYELWLSGNIDCVVLEYEDAKDYKGEPDHQTPSLRELLHGLLRPLARPWWI
jgi:hypothetical protein